MYVECLTYNSHYILCYLKIKISTNHLYTQNGICCDLTFLLTNKNKYPEMDLSSFLKQLKNQKHILNNDFQDARLQAMKDKDPW